MTAYKIEDFEVGDTITMGVDGVRSEFRNESGTVTEVKEKQLMVNFPNIAISAYRGKPVSVGIQNIVKLDKPGPSEEEVRRLFGIKEREEQKEEAIALIGQAEANVLRLSAAVDRANAARVTDSPFKADDDRWDVIRDAESELHLATAMCKELHADYVERFGILDYRKDFK